MPKLSALVELLFGKLFTFFASFLGVKYATRMLAVTAIATSYLACVGVFTSYIAPLFAAITSTSFGFILGLLFPPLSGSIIAGLMSYRMCVVILAYTSKLMKLAVG